MSLTNSFLIIFEKVSQLFFSSEFAFWVSLRLLDAEDTFLSELLALFGEGERDEILKLRRIARETVEERNGSLDSIVESIILKASEISDKVTSGKKQCGKSERLDKILTGRISAFPIMLLFLFFVLWITLSLANYPSLLLSSLFSFVSERAHEFFEWSGLPIWLSGLLIAGIFKTVSQVVAVMLPPMVIFFPLFSLLEDSGYLPRIAYNLDRPFACSGACGKQALTMCMGLGCNAVGIVGCRIIDSKRERNLAIVTTALRPCNGRLPMLIHTGDYRYDYSNPNRMLPILDKYPDLTVIGAHFGGWSIWEDATEKFAGYKNFLVDCSSSLYAMTSEKGVELIHAYGADRVLFGTDYPLWDPKTELERFMALDLTGEEREDILYNNAARLFGIS